MLPLSLFNFVYYWSFSVFVAFVPLYFQGIGLSPGEIGALLAIGPFVSIFSQPFWGYMSDRKGAIKRVVVFLLIITLFVSSAVFIGKTFWIISVSMALFYFFMSSIQPLADSIATVYTQTHRKNYGAIRMWGSIGFSSASFAIGLLISYIGIGKIGYIYATIIVISLLVSFRLPDAAQQSGQVSRQGGQASKKEIRTIARNKTFLPFLFAVMLISIPHRMNDNMLGLYMQSLGGTEAQIGTAWTIAALSEAPVIGLMALVMRKVHPLLLISLAGFLYSLRWLLYSLIDTPSVLMYTQVFHSVTFAVFLVAAFQYVTSLVPRELLATGQTIFFAVFSGLSGIIGSALGGYLVEKAGGVFMYQTASAIALLGAALCGVMFWGLKKNNKTRTVQETVA